MRRPIDGGDPLWLAVRQEAVQQAQDEPILASFLHTTVLNHATLEEAVSFQLAPSSKGPTCRRCCCAR
jgi:serine O-acetyltransferase